MTTANHPDGARTVSGFQMRLLALGLLCSLGVLALGGRLFQLTVTMRDSLRERAELQQQHTLKLDSERGTLFDRNGNELATSVDVESIYAVPSSFPPESVAGAVDGLSACLALSEKTLAPRLTSGKRFVWLLRKARPSAVSCVRGLELDGIGFVDETRRFYPKRHLASQVLGYVGIDNEGMSGVEYALEQSLRGEPGRRIIWTDARNRRAASRVEKRARPGRAAYLTIDENLQFIAEAELREAIVDSRAKSGIAILMRPRTGELLAVASYPGFNPNRYGDFPAGNWRNRAVTDVYEPGSTFKLVTAAAALSENVTSEDERIDCGRGFIQVGDHVINDASAFDVLTFREVVEKSSNVGMVRIGQRLGKARLEAYTRAFGFGELSGVELPGESRGIFRDSASWGALTHAAISFGQEIGVTPLQMVSAANVLASAGYLMKPRLLLGFGDSTGRLHPSFSPEPVRRVIDEDVARRLTDLLTGAVERGTGRRAQIEGYRVAGKTGTAQKAVPGGYSKTDYIASFVGFAPADRPALTALVILDSPEGDHSGSRAAGVFARIVERSLHYLGVPSHGRPLVRVAKQWPQSRPILDGRGGAGPLPTSLVAASGSRPDATPSVVGLPARDALARLVARGVVPEILGSGWVVEQEPAAGTQLEPGSRVRLYLGPHGVVSRPTRPPVSDEPIVADGAGREPALIEKRWPGTTE